MNSLKLAALILLLGLASLTAGNLSRFQGDWAILYTNGAVRYYSISDRGRVIWVESGRIKEAILEPSGRFYLLDFGDKKLERFVPDGLSFRVEHYSPGIRLRDGFPAVVGTPERTRYFQVNKIKTK